MTGAVRLAANLARGFDCNDPLTSASVRAFRDHGYAFAIRYVRRGPPHPYDLTPAEVATILSAGVGLMAVQHVESARSWVPSAMKGDAYGAAAVAHACELELPTGAMLWCDLEGVADGTPADDVVAYVNGWYDVVSTADYLPGLYIGWHAGLDADALYRRLRMQHYWAAYNLNSDELPAVRGVQMHQWAVTPETRAKDVPNGITFPFQVDTVLADKLGGLPAMIVAEGP